MATAMRYNDKQYLKAQRKLATGDLYLVIFIGIVFFAGFIYTDLIITLVLALASAFLAEYIHAIRDSIDREIKDIERKERKGD